jgi:hypothetical protein
MIYKLLNHATVVLRLSKTIKQENAGIFCKIGHFREKGALDNNSICLPRHSSFTINHTFANLGKTGQNELSGLEIITVWAAKIHG